MRVYKKNYVGDLLKKKIGIQIGVRYSKNVEKQ